MPAKTAHIIPQNDGWVVRKEDVAAPRTVYATQKEAIGAAAKMVKRTAAGQIVIHERNGSMRWRDSHGLPVVQRTRRKSSLGTDAIKRAVSAVIRERLESA